jgi:hypothetical protein
MKADADEAADVARAEPAAMPPPTTTLEESSSTMVSSVAAGRGWAAQAPLLHAAAENAAGCHGATSEKTPASSVLREERDEVRTKWWSRNDEALWMPPRAMSVNSVSCWYEAAHV